MKAFKIDIAAEQIEDLKERLLRTRWPDEIIDSKWDYGTNLSYLKELCTYWHRDFNWKIHQQSLNQFDHYKTEIKDQNLHFIYQKGRGTENRPLMLLHGWPDSFYRFTKLIPLLTEPDENGFAFDVVIPSIPGFGFSDKPKQPGMGPVKIASLFSKLMTEQLGYETFLVHGGDWGASIATQMAIQNKNIAGLHLTNIPPELFFTTTFAELTDDEKTYLKYALERQRKEGGYLAILSTSV